MNNKTITNTLKGLATFIAGSTFNNYYVKTLNSKEIREQSAKDIIACGKENQMHNMNNTISGMSSKMDNFHNDMKYQLDSLAIASPVENLVAPGNKNSDHILAQIKPRVEKICDSGEQLVAQQIVNGEVNPDIAPIVNPNYSSVFNQILKNLSSEAEKIIDLIESQDSSSNKFISEFNLDRFYEYLDSLSLIQELAFLHILLFFILFCTVFNILAIFFGNEIIKYFNIEKKFPSLAVFFKLRSTYQRYYLLWNILLMCIVCFAGIYIDVFTYYVNP